MSKNVMFITMKKFFHKDTLVTDLEYTITEKEVNETRAGTYYYSSNRQLKYNGEPSITYTFPSGKLCAYSIDMSKEDTLRAMLKEMERPINNKICMYLRKRDASIAYKHKYNQMLDEAMAEHSSYKTAVKKFKEENNLS